MLVAALHELSEQLSDVIHSFVKVLNEGQHLSVARVGILDPFLGRLLGLEAFKSVLCCFVGLTHAFKHSECVSEVLMDFFNEQIVALYFLYKQRIERLVLVYAQVMVEERQSDLFWDLTVQLAKLVSIEGEQ